MVGSVVTYITVEVEIAAGCSPGCIKRVELLWYIINDSNDV